MKVKWMRSWAQHALLISEMSPCPRGKVGAVLVDPRNNPISMGFNGPPRGCSGSLCGGSVCERDERGVQSGHSTEVGCHHAEANALTNALANGISSFGCSLIVSRAPCLMCAKLIHHSGVSLVVICGPEPPSSVNGIPYLKEVGVRVVSAPPVK